MEGRNVQEEGMQTESVSLKEWLRDRGVTLSWLAAKAGLSYPALRGWIAGQWPFPDDAREKVANVLCETYRITRDQLPTF